MSKESKHLPQICATCSHFRIDPLLTPFDLFLSPFYSRPQRIKGLYGRCPLKPGTLKWTPSNADCQEYLPKQTFFGRFCLLIAPPEPKQR